MTFISIIKLVKTLKCFHYFCSLKSDMRKILNFCVLVFLLVIGSHIRLFSQSSGNLYLPKPIQEFLQPMNWIDKGVYIVNPPEGIQLNEEDTNLMLRFEADTINIFPFYISETEITNKEYRDFVYWVRDSILRTFSAIRDNRYYSNAKNGTLNFDIPLDWLLEEFRCFSKDPENKKPLTQMRTDFFNYGPFFGDNHWQIINVYPDTTVWTKEFPYGFMQTMAENYFSHPAYDNYPVVGISYNQALAFCDWKTRRLQETFEKSGVKFPEGLAYRLPTEKEWQYAALSNFSFDFTRIYPWKGIDIRNAKEYNSNFGTITDRNKMIIKRMEDDGNLFTAKAKSYQANENFLFNMSGNVSEWVIPDIKSYVGIARLFVHLNDSSHRTDSLNAVLNYLAIMYGECYINERIYDKSFILQAGKTLSKIQLILNNDYSVAKGGSWADQPLYLLPSAYAIYRNKNAVSSKTGFRIVLDTYGIPIKQEEKRKLPKPKV